MERPGTPEADREAWLDDLVRLYERPLLRLCFLEIGDRQLAEDAVQETYLKALRHFGRLRQYENVQGWLAKTAVNTCRDMRKTGWFRHHNRYVTPEMLPEAAEDFTARDESITLVVMALPDRLREVVLLRCVQGLNQREIAKLLGLSPSAVCTRLERARKKLRAVLEGGDENA